MGKKHDRSPSILLITPLAQGMGAMWLREARSHDAWWIEDCRVHETYSRLSMLMVAEFPKSRRHTYPRSLSFLVFTIAVFGFRCPALALFSLISCLHQLSTLFDSMASMIYVSNKLSRCMSPPSKYHLLLRLTCA